MKEGNTPVPELFVISVTGDSAVHSFAINNPDLKGATSTGIRGLLGYSCVLGRKKKKKKQ